MVSLGLGTVAEFAWVGNLFALTIARGCALWASPSPLGGDPSPWGPLPLVYLHVVGGRNQVAP